MSFQIGDRVGDYRIVGAVGSGGAGQVFKVEHEITGRLDAMKVLLQGREESKQAPAERYKWNLFDQIMFTKTFFNTAPNTFSFEQANIFDDDFLKLFNGKYKRKPFRTYVGKKYKGGYSDHFPVYATLKKNL